MSALQGMALVFLPKWGAPHVAIVEHGTLRLDLTWHGSGARIAVARAHRSAGKDVVIEEPVSLALVEEIIAERSRRPS